MKMNFLKRSMAMIMLSCMSVMVFAAESYTIEFNDVPGLTGSDQSQAATTIADIIKSGAEYVSGLNATSVYRAREGYGVKFGTGSKAGSLTLTLADAVTPDSIVLTACSYSVSEGALVFMGDINIDATNGGVDNKKIANYKKEYDGKTSVSEITIATSAKRAYVISVTVYPHKAEIMEGPAAAPTVPAYKANQVKAVYSETYGADCGFGEWGSGTQFTQDTYGKKFVTGPLGYFGLTFEDNALNCSAMESLHLDVWSDVDMSLRIVPIHGGAEVGITKNIKAGEWNAIDIALAEFTGVTNWTNVFQIKIDNVPSSTFWVNNVYFYTTQAVADDTEAPTEVSAVLESAGYFTANIKAQATDNSGSVIFEVLDGETLLATKNAASATETVIEVAGLKAGTAYTLAVVAKDETGNAAMAVNVAVETLAAPAPVTAPMVAAEDVYAIYSDAYAENHTPYEYNQGWWANPTMTNVVLGEQDNAIMYTSNGDPNGCFGWAWGETTTDLTGYNKLHLDIYAQESGSIMLGITRQGSDNITETPNITAGEWNAIDIDLTEQDLTKFFQIGFWNFSTLKCFFVDNVYFYKNNGIGAALDIPVATKTVQKYILNGQLVIVRDGVYYNALGQIVNQ